MISILLPTYNSAEYLAESMKSILLQTFKDFEFLIVDDGSIDNTEELVKTFNDYRIKYIKKQHTGLADTLNYGLKIAKYDLIARMDADDISHPKRLELQINYLNSHPEIDWISCWYAVFNKRLKYLIKLPEKSEDIKKNLILSSSICFPGSIFSKIKILEEDGFLGEVFEDYEFLLRKKNKLNFYNIQQVLYFQRNRKNSLSKKNYNKIKQIHYNIQKSYYLNLEKEFKLKNKSEVNYYKGWREFLYGDKNLARKYWISFGITVFFKPKLLICFILTFIPVNQFKSFRKIGFKFLPFYSFVVSNNFQNEFERVIKYLRKINF